MKPRRGQRNCVLPVADGWFNPLQPADHDGFYSSTWRQNVTYTYFMRDQKHRPIPLLRRMLTWKKK